MKTFLLNIPNDIKNWNNSLDAKALLCSQSWNVFNDEGVKEVYIFKNDGTLIASHNGQVTKAKWEYIPQNTSLIIENLGTDIYMLNPVSYDDKVLTLQVDGTNNYALLINAKYVQQLMLDSFAKAKLYIEEPQKYARQKEETARQEQQEIERREKEASLALEKKKADWEDYIQKKAEEHLNTPEIKEKMAKCKKMRRVIIPTCCLCIIISTIGRFIIGTDMSSLALVGILVFLFTVIISISLLFFIIAYNYSKDDAINDMKVKYPFDSFNQQTSEDKTTRNQ